MLQEPELLLKCIPHTYNQGQYLQISLQDWLSLAKDRILLIHMLKEKHHLYNKEIIRLTQSKIRCDEIGFSTMSWGNCDNVNAAFKPSVLQSEMIQPWSLVEWIHPPLEMWWYQKFKSLWQPSWTYVFSIYKCAFLSNEWQSSRRSVDKRAWVAKDVSQTSNVRSMPWEVNSMYMHRWILTNLINV